MIVMTRDQFAKMDESFTAGTKDCPEAVGISVACWRLQNIMAATRWALANGYEFTKELEHGS